MSAGEKDLDELRAAIDAIDSDILKLINARAALAIEVGQLKRSEGHDTVFYRPDREAIILKRVLERNPGPMSADEAARIMRELMSACLALENPLTIAYLGPAGTYTHLAALKQFGGSLVGAPVGSIDEVMREVESGGADFGVVPVENSIEGGVSQTLDALRGSQLKICGEVLLGIHHQLLGNGHDLGAIKKVYAHAQALAQCRRWLAANLPQVECVPSSSNAEAARMVAGDHEAAAIAAEVAAEIYHLEILHRNIEDAPGNTTRFLIVGNTTPAASGNDITSLMFTTANRPGALHDVLSVLAQANISMTRIESRPMREAAWDYVFFVDVDGHADLPAMQVALRALEVKTSYLKVLGAYPRAVM